MTRAWSVLPALVCVRGDAASVTADVLVVGVVVRDGIVQVRSASLSDAALHTLTASAQAIAHKGAAGAVVRIPAPAGVSAASVLLVGLGDFGADASRAGAGVTEALRRAAGTAMGALDGAGHVAIALPAEGAGELEAVALGALLGSYRYTTHRSGVGLAADGDRTISLLTHDGGSDPAARATIIATAVAGARDLVNAPSSHLFPESFADLVFGAAQDMAQVVVEIVDEAELRERGFGGLIGVGAGSSRSPRLVKVSYAPEGADRHLSLVGKGITFDSGGISIKPAANMEKMKNDMAGAAAAVQALFAVAELSLPVRVTAWLALAENMPSGSALRPSDVIRIYGGKSVEVINTDAEGRLVLADALVVAQEEQPDLLLDIATLTGAQVAALGYRTSGVMGTPGARDVVVSAGDVVGEPMWPMPIPEEMLAGFESRTADLKNTGKPGGGMLGAAAFLGEFVRVGVEWAHLDIAGPAFHSDQGYGYITPGGTGVAVRTIIEVAQHLASGYRLYGESDASRDPSSS